MIKCLDIEISSICQAGCPVCPRRVKGRFARGFNQTYWKYDKLIKTVTEKTAKGLDKLVLCGNLGDPMGNPDIYKIVKWFKDINPNLLVHISTNGGIGKSEVYSKLADLNVTMVFGIDGYQTGNELYRIGVEWEQLEENFKAFDTKHKRSIKEIQYLMWDQTMEQVKPVVDWARANGGTGIYFKPPWHHFEHTKVYTMKNKYSHSLTYTESEFKRQISKMNKPKYFRLSKVWALQNDIEYTSLINTIKKYQEKAKEVFKATSDVDQVPIVQKPYHYNYTTPQWSEHELEQHKKLNKQTCFSKNFYDHEEIEKSIYNLYITYNGYLMPCCFIPSMYQTYFHGDEELPRVENENTDRFNPYVLEINNKLLDLDLESFSLKNKTIQEVLDTGVLHKFTYDSLGLEDGLKFCKTACAKSCV